MVRIEVKWDARKAKDENRGGDMTSITETNGMSDSEIRVSIRESFLASLNSHLAERTPRTLYWDLLWIHSFLVDMFNFYTMTQGSSHRRIEEFHVLLGRLFDEAFPYEPQYRLHPDIAVKAICYAFEVVVPEICLSGVPLSKSSKGGPRSGQRIPKPLDEETLVFDFEGANHRIAILDTYEHVRNAFNTVQEPLRDSVSRMGKPLDDRISDPITLSEAKLLMVKTEKCSSGAVEAALNRAYKSKKESNRILTEMLNGVRHFSREQIVRLSDKRRDNKSRREKATELRRKEYERKYGKIDAENE